MQGLSVLGSGSRGNAIFLGASKTKILVDIGLSARQIIDRLAEIDVDISELDAVLISHEHRDHINGINLLSRNPHIACYANRLTAENLSSVVNEIPENIQIFSNGEEFSIGEFRINPFSVLHDSIDPVGFEIKFNDQKICIATDLGCATRLVRERLRGANYVILETNHDEEMLKNDIHRPWSVKQRILSKTGHLSNRAAGELLAEVAHDSLKAIVLAHISKDCNKKTVARKTVLAHLEKIGKGNIAVELSYQDKVYPQIIFS